MRKYLIIDNFRGFTDTYIPLTDVNFLVGQNSTGKTSVLGLLKLFSSHRFFMTPNFGDEEVNFGHFTDMVSAHAEDRSYFRIGLIEERAFGKKNKSFITSATLFTFREHDGLPRLFQLTYTMGDRHVHLRFNERQVRYKLTEDSTRL